MQVMDNYYNKPGANMMHEAIEAYEGAVETQRTGRPALSSDIDIIYYNRAHKFAEAIAPQPGKIFEEPKAIDGKLVPKDDPSRVKIDYVIDNGTKAPIIIQANP